MGVARRYDSVVCCVAGNENVNEYNQGILQSHSADQPMGLREETKNIESKATSSLSSSLSLPFSLSLFPNQIIAKRETTLSIAQQNYRNPTQQ